MLPMCSHCTAYFGEELLVVQYLKLILQFPAIVLYVASDKSFSLKIQMFTFFT